MKKILIADDEESIRQILSDYVRSEGFEPLIARDGVEALQKFYSWHDDISVVLLDIMMPKKDGLAVCREIRQTSMVPIIMITAKKEDHDRILGLDTGADDYVLKPFSVKVVMARIRAMLRRVGASEGAAPKTFTCANLKLDTGSYDAEIDGQRLALTKKEFDLLWTLAHNASMVMTRDMLLDKVWGQDYEGEDRTVDSHVKRLRQKLDRFEHPLWNVRTVWGRGYCFENKEKKKS